MNWVAKEIKTKRVGRINHSQTSIPGTDAWEFTHPACPMPLGVMWVRWVGKSTLDILYIFTSEKYRRCGIATRILNEIVRSYPDGIKEVITGELNRYSLPWGKRLGFTQDKECGHWRLAVNRAKGKQEAA